MKHILSMILAAVCSLSAVADGRDSLPAELRPPVDKPIVGDSLVPLPELPMNATLSFTTPAIISASVPYKVMPGFKPPMIQPGIIAAWQGGALVGSVSQTHLPGLMAIEQGNISIGQRIGNFSFSAYAEALKYGSFGALQRQTGVGLSLSYDISKRVGITLYGSLYSNPGRMTHAMAGFAAASAVGGYVDWRISDRFGVKAGARVERNMATNRWHAQPTLVPYFRINKHDVIGVDVGGILYNLLYWNRHNRLGPVGNPTMGPPVMKHSEIFGY